MNFLVRGCVYGCIQNLKSIPRGSFGPPPCQKPRVQQRNSTLKILPLKLLLLENEDEDVKVP